MGVGKDRKGLGDNNVRAREDIGLKERINRGISVDGRDAGG